jgi:RNA polymerase sigma factor (sigma-70 family)
VNDRTDQQLLREYAEYSSEEAFAEIVRRHVDLVHSAALRMVRDADLAKDVTQSVFASLACRARELESHPVLSGWLHRTARNLAVKTVRSEVRRRLREKESAAMNELHTAESADVWTEIAPHLDSAIDELADSDRDAVLLRYFERKSSREMALRLGTSEEAAQKRVDRAVERLRKLFARRGVGAGAGALVAAVSTYAVQASPVGLVESISTATIGTAATGATAAIAAKTIAMTTLQKTIATITVAAALGVGVYHARQASDLRAEADEMRRQHAPLTNQLGQLIRERDQVGHQIAALGEENERLKEEKGELLKLRREVARRRNESQELAKLKAIVAGDQTLAGAASWKDRVNRLKERLEQTPGAKTPELQLISEKDWLNAARGDLETETDYRRALATLRAAGEGKLAGMIKNALSGYLSHNDKQMPTDIVQLLPYFDSSVNAGLLERWEIAPASTIKSLRMGGDVIITQKAPVDDVFDSRYGIGPSGFGQTDFLSPELAPIMDPVYDAFRKSHNGQWPNDVSQLTSYTSTPEQQAALQKLILKNSISN